MCAVSSLIAVVSFRISSVSSLISRVMDLCKINQQQCSKCSGRPTIAPYPKRYPTTIYTPLDSTEVYSYHLDQSVTISERGRFPFQHVSEVTFRSAQEPLQNL